MGEANHKNFTDKQCRYTSYITPPKILDPIREYFNQCDGRGIVLDPATTKSNPVGADVFFTGDPDDGLIESWDQENVWVNPPYGKYLKLWVRKIAMEAKDGAHIIALLPGQRFEQQYFQEFVFNSRLTAMCMVRSRVNFLNEEGAVQKGNPYGSMLYLYNGEREVFAEVFKTLGLCLAPTVLSRKIEKVKKELGE